MATSRWRGQTVNTRRHPLERPGHTARRCPRGRRPRPHVAAACAHAPVACLPPTSPLHPGSIGVDVRARFLKIQVGNGRRASWVRRSVENGRPSVVEILGSHRRCLTLSRRDSSWDAKSFSAFRPGGLGRPCCDQMPEARGACSPFARAGAGKGRGSSPTSSLTRVRPASQGEIEAKCADSSSTYITVNT